MRQHEWFHASDHYKNSTFSAMTQLIYVEDSEGALKACQRNPYAFCMGVKDRTTGVVKAPLKTMILESSFSFNYEFAAGLSFNTPVSSLKKDPTLGPKQTDDLDFLGFMKQYAKLSLENIQTDLSTIPAFLEGLKANASLGDQADRQLACLLLINMLPESFRTVNRWHLQAPLAHSYWIQGWQDALELAYEKKSSLPLTMSEQECSTFQSRLTDSEQGGAMVWWSYTTSRWCEAFIDHADDRFKNERQERLEEGDVIPRPSVEHQAAHLAKTLYLHEEALLWAYQKGWVSIPDFNSAYDDLWLTVLAPHSVAAMESQAGPELATIIFTHLCESLPIRALECAAPHFEQVENSLFYALLEGALLRRAVHDTSATAQSPSQKVKSLAL